MNDSFYYFLAILLPQGETLLLALMATFFKLFLSYLPLLKFLGLTVTVFLLAGAVYLAITTNFIGVKMDVIVGALKSERFAKKRALRGWLKIQKYISKGDEASLKLAIIEADNILDEVLQAGGFPGKNLGERLKNITSAQISNLDEIWEAHKIRNRLAHETDFSLDFATASRVILIYEKTFKDLELLD